MGQYNLLEEAWISVIADDSGKTEEVSLKELFENAHSYRGLAGEMKAQDFAVLRMLLAVLHTVFSRFSADGNQYKWVRLDNRYRQIEKVKEDDREDYIEDLKDTWKTLWNRHRFPPVIGEYLEKWRDRFFLFDEAYPFFQVRKEELSEDKINKKQGTETFAKDLNRLITESGNKIAFFSPKSGEEKNNLKISELVRWLLTYHGYTGTGGKAFFGRNSIILDDKGKEKSQFTKAYSTTHSKGWLYDLGGICLDGHDLFETLMLNLVLVHPVEQFNATVQKPCWEYDPASLIKQYLTLELREPDNLASLYTNWSYAIYIDADNVDIKEGICSDFSCFKVKLPEINHIDMFLEPMTIWRYNESGDNKNKFTPQKHRVNESLWRSFGIISLNCDPLDSKHRAPGVIEWLHELKKYMEDDDINLFAISMADDGNAASWVPTDEIVDTLSIDDQVFTDLREAGWLVRINDVVDRTKKVISGTYKIYISDIRSIRNISSADFVNRKVEEIYFKIDNPFRMWLSSLSVDDDQDEKLYEWLDYLKMLVKREARAMFLQATSRDYMGIPDGKDKIKNIASSYNKFINILNKQIKNRKEV